MSSRKDRYRVAPRSLSIYWCRDCQCARFRPCGYHQEVSDPSPITYRRGNLYGIGRQPGRRRKVGVKEGGRAGVLTRIYWHIRDVDGNRRTWPRRFSTRVEAEAHAQKCRGPYPRVEIYEYEHPLDVAVEERALEAAVVEAAMAWSDQLGPSDEFETQRMIDACAALRAFRDRESGR